MCSHCGVEATESSTNEQHALTKIKLPKRSSSSFPPRDVEDKLVDFGLGLRQIGLVTFSPFFLLSRTLKLISLISANGM